MVSAALKSDGSCCVSQRLAAVLQRVEAAMIKFLFAVQVCGVSF
jgi:hypothetical protein